MQQPGANMKMKAQTLNDEAGHPCPPLPTILLL